MISIELPVKALSINAAYRGRRFKTPEYIAFEREVSLLLPMRKDPIRGPVDVMYIFRLKNAARTDVDNCIKAFQDLLVKRNYIEDDRKIFKITAEKITHPQDSIYFRIKQYAIVNTWRTKNPKWVMGDKRSI